MRRVLIVILTYDPNQRDAYRGGTGDFVQAITATALADGLGHE